MCAILGNVARNMHSDFFWMYLCLLLSVILAEEDSPCTINITGEEATCKLISNCPYALDLLKNRRYPQTCGFIGKEPIVCCLMKFENQTKLPTAYVSTENPNTASQLATTEKANVVQTRPTLTFQNLVLVSDRNVGDLSRNKCLTYYPKPIRPVFVTGGLPSLAREFPHMAAIGYGHKENIQWLCGGSLVSKKFVLTAAHCLTSNVTIDHYVWTWNYQKQLLCELKPRPALNYIGHSKDGILKLTIGEARFVRLGDLDLSSEDDVASPEDFTIARTIPHPSYKPPVRYHDIALLELDREVALSAFVSPACLYAERELNWTSLTATGWGKTEFRGNLSSVLMKVDLDYVPNGECAESFRKTSKMVLPNGVIDDFQVCAGGNIGEDTCQGDSGGPLQVNNPERTFTVKVHSLIGVTSFGKSCGLSRAPGVYTRIFPYLSWIESFAWKDEKHLYGPLN